MVLAEKGGNEIGGGGGGENDNTAVCLNDVPPFRRRKQKSERSHWAEEKCIITRRRTLPGSPGERHKGGKGFLGTKNISPVSREKSICDGLTWGGQLGCFKLMGQGKKSQAIKTNVGKK